MLKITLAALLALATSTAISGGLYKCTDPATGKVTFSQVQCATDAAPLDLDVYRPSAEQIAEHERRIQAGEEWVDRVRQDRAERYAAIARARAIQAVQDQYAAEQARIARRRARANNNAAGAALEGALATDAATSDSRYNAMMERLNGTR